jgi:predicted PurR-regulated permease PerM
MTEEADQLSRVRWLGLLAAVGVALYLCWLMLEPFLDVLAWAGVLVIVFYPVHQEIEKALSKPGWSAMLSSLLVIVIILAPLTMITFAVVRELRATAQGLQSGIDALLDPNSPVTGPVLRWISQYVDIEQWRSQEYLTDRLKAMSGAIAQRSIGIVGGVAGTLIQIFFVIFTMYYLFRDGGRIRNSLYDLLPLETNQARAIVERMNEVIGASVYGVLVISLLQGTLGGLAFWVLGLPSPLLWGVVMVFLSIIPLVGSSIVWVPAAIVLIASGHWVKALILVIWGALVIGMVDNFLRPKMVGGRTRLHELLIFFSVLGGLQVFGVLGLVLGPVVAAVTLALIDVVRQVDRTGEIAPIEKSGDDSLGIGAG